MYLSSLVSVLFLAAVVASTNVQTFEEALRRRDNSTRDPLQVDLGYGIYRGSHDAAAGINTWKG